LTQPGAALRPSMLTSEREHLSGVAASVATPHQLQRLRVIDTDKASSSTATSSTTPSSSILYCR